MLRQRKRGGTVEYLVKWKGYDEDEQSWEPEENLKNCQKEIAAFNKKEVMLNNCNGLMVLALSLKPTRP